MKKLRLLPILSFILCACSNSPVVEQVEEKSVLNKTSIELEDESISLGIRIDTLSRGFVFGMSKDQVIDQCKKLANKNEIGYLEDGSPFYKFETKNFVLNNCIDFYYDQNEKLYRIVEFVLPQMNQAKNENSINFKDEVLEDTKKNYGNSPLSNSTMKNSKLFWLENNLRIDYLENEKTSYVAYTDIPAERRFNEYILKQEKELNQKQQIKNDSLENVKKIAEEKIIQQLKEKAKKDWPEDYTTQEYWVNEQINAYRYMLTIPENDKIKRKAQRDWPLDFQTQKYWYNQQIEAKERLN